MKCGENIAEKLSITDTKTKNEKLAAELKLSKDKMKNNIFKINKLAKSTSCPSVFREYSKTIYSFSKTKSLSEQSLHIKKYRKIQHSNRNSIEKNLNCTKKKSKAPEIESQTSIDDALNTSLDESDTGLTSDDQEGQVCIFMLSNLLVSLYLY